MRSLPGTDSSIAIIACTYGGHGGQCVDWTNIASVGSAPGGNGKWGQSDLAGNPSEWVLDFEDANNGGLVNPCLDCAQLACNPFGQRRDRGGNWTESPTGLIQNSRWHSYPPDVGLSARCARSP